MLVIPPAAYALAAAAFLLGLLIARLLWGGGRARADRLEAELASERAALADARENRLRLEREVAAGRDQVKPLADEVDRLRRENARIAARAPVVIAAGPGDARADTVPVASPVPLPDPADLRVLKGVGDKLAERLVAHGVRTTRDLAALSPDHAARIDADLGPFAGRIARDRLIEQARLLSDGRITEFEAIYGKLGS